MQPFRKHTGKVAPLYRANVDTDQIIPKQFLKRIERTGFGEFLFNDWRRTADGTPDPDFTNFGLAWYQSDVHITADGTGAVKIKTILLDQIFGFDPVVSLPPTNTFHVGFWFNNPADAVPCGFTGSTPFNGEHNAGPVAFITRPNATTGLGPLCTNPTSGPPFSCIP